jgi:hypothetical protein
MIKEGRVTENVVHFSDLEKKNYKKVCTRKTGREFSSES